MRQLLSLFLHYGLSQSVILHGVSDPVEPGSTSIVYGSGLGSNVTITACAMGGAPGDCTPWPSVQSWESSYKSIVPAGSEPAIYSLSVPGISNSVLLNAPTLQWYLAEGSEVEGVAVPGSTLRVFGVNLAWSLEDRNCPSLGLGATNSTPPPPPGVYALLVSAIDASQQYPVHMPLATCYRLDLTLPSTLPPGNYSLYVNNGLWRDWAPPSMASLPPPLIDVLQVAPSPPWPTTVFTVGETVGCENVTACLITATSAGGGVVSLPPGVYHMASGQPIILGPRVALNGSGQGEGGSALVWSNNGGGPIGAGGWITGGPNPWRLMNLLAVFSSGMWGQPGVLIGAGSVGAWVENVTVWINTTDRTGTGTGITVGEGGNRTRTAQWVVRGSTFYTSPGVTCPINSWPRNCGFYFTYTRGGAFYNNTFISGCQGWSVIDSSNLFLSDLYIQSIGENSDGNGFANYYYPQVLENVYMGNSVNIGNYKSTLRWETMTFDAAGMDWNGPISSYSPGSTTTIVLPGDPIRNGYDYTGHQVVVVGGVGLNQYRRVLGYSRGPGGQSTWYIDSPFATPLVPGNSTVAVYGYRGSITFESNTYLNGTAFQFYGAATNVRVASCEFIGMNVSGIDVDAECAVCEGNGGVLLGWGKGMGANTFQPALFMQALNNSLTCSTKLISTACGGGNLTAGQEFLTYGIIHRGNSLAGTDHLLGYAGGKSSFNDASCRDCVCWGATNSTPLNQPTVDVIAEGNTVGDAVCFGQTRNSLFLVNRSSTLQLWIPQGELEAVDIPNW